MRHDLARITFRLLLIWLLVSIIFFVASESLIKMLLPYLTWITNHVAENFNASLHIADGDYGKLISISIIATEDIYRQFIPIAPLGTQLTASVTVIHALVPLVILFTIVFAWPTTLRKLACRSVIALLFSLVLLGLTTPFLLVGNIEQSFLLAAQNFSGKNLAAPWIINWVIFIEVGGAWLMAIFAAVVCIKTTS